MNTVPIFRFTPCRCLILVFLGVVLSSALSVAQEAAESRESATAILKRVLGDEGIDAARKKFRELTTDKERYSFDASEFVALGHGLFIDENIPGAVAILEMTVELFPESKWGHFMLGTAYFKAGEPDLAKKSRLKMQSVEKKADLKDFLENHPDPLLSTAEAVIEKHLESIGGRDAVAGIRSMVVTFGVNSTGGNNTKMIRYYKRPGLYRQGVVGGDRFTTTDGDSTWSVNGNEWKVTKEQAYKRMGSIEGNFLDYSARGITYEFAGVEIFNNTPVYKLKRTFWDGFEQNLYFSIEAGYLTEIESDYPQTYPVMRSVMSYWDYRDVGGIKIPHVFIRNMNELGPPHGGVVEDVQVNVPLDDSLFVKPASE